MHHSSTSTYIPNFIEIGETFCGRTDVGTDVRMGGRTFETHFIIGMLIPGYVESRDPNRQSRVPTGTRKGRNRRTYGE